MTSNVASRAERLVSQRLKTDIQAASLIAGLSSGQITGDMPAVLANRLAAPRFRHRLERRFMRKAKVLDSLPTLLDSEAEAIASYGEHGLHALIVDTGIVCHHAALRRIVDAQTLSELGGLLGIALDTHDARIVKASESLSIARSITTKSPADVEPLAAAILHDGLHCWNCWIEHQPASLHGFFRRMTPSALRMQDMPDGVTRARSDCRHRVSLFDARRALVTERDEVPLRRKA